MYGLTYVDPQTMPEEDHFPAKKMFFVNHKNISTPGQGQKHCLGFSYIRSGYYELYNNFDYTELKKEPYNTSSNKDIYFCESVVVIEEEWFYGMNLTDGATLPTPLIKRAKTRVKNKINFPRDTKRRIQ